MGELLNKQTGQVEQVPDAQMAQAWLSGNYGAKPGTVVNVVKGQGEDAQLGTLPLEAFAHQPGDYRAATPEDIAAYDKQKKYGTLPQQAATAAEGALRGASVGLSTPVLKALGDDSKEQLARQEINPRLAMGSELAGAVAPIVLSGGEAAPAEAGTAAKLLRAATAGPRAVATLGRAAEGVAARSVGEGLLGRTVGALASGAAEGAAFGAGGAVSDASLHDEDLTAERVIAGAGNGALFGGVAGGALSLAGSGVRAAGSLIGSGARAGYDAAAGLFGRGAADAGAAGATSAAGEAGSESARDLSATAESPGRAGADSGMINKLVEGQRSVRDLDAVQERATRQLAKTGDESIHTLDKILDGITMKGKWDAVGRAIQEQGGVDLDAVATSADDALIKLQTAATDIKENVGGAFAPAEVGAAKKTLVRAKAAREAITEAYVNGDEGAAQKIFSTVDTMKRQLGTTAARLPGHEGGAGEMLRGLYEDFQAHLQDPALYGNAAAAIQREDNAKWTKLFDVWRPFTSTFTRDAGGARFGDGFEHSLRLDPAKAAGFITGSHTAARSLDREVFDRYMSSSGELVKQLVDSHDANPKLRELAEKYAQSAAGMQGAIATAEQTAAQAAAHRAVVEDVSRIPGALPAFKHTVNVADRARAWSTQRAEVAAQASFVAKAARTAQEAAISLVRRTDAAVSGMLSTVSRAAPALAAVGTHADSRAYAENRKKDFDEKSEHIQELASNASALTDRVHAHGGGALDKSPQYMMAYAGAQQRGVQFLASKLPAQNKPAQLLRPDLDKLPRTSPGDQAKWLRYAAAVEKPKSVLDDMSHGKLTREGVEALQAVYPKMYADLKERVIHKVADMKTAPTFAQAQQLSLLTGVPLHPALAPDFIAMVQKGYATSRGKSKDGSQKSQHAQAPSMSSAMLTNTQKLEQASK